MNNSYITIIKEKRTALSRKRIPLNQNGCTANFRIGVPFEQNLHLILGNLLENAVEAAEKVEENRYINVKMKFDKNNLLLFVDNSYKGKLLKTRDNRLKSTKSDAENHGVGLASVYRAVAKYHGSVVIEDSEPGKFKIRIVLYSNVQE